jgi:hypothetical protein
VSSTVFLVVIYKDYGFSSNSSLMGLAISWSLVFASQISFTLRIMADTENYMNSVVRMLEYINDPNFEKDWKKPEIKD